MASLSKINILFKADLKSFSTQMQNANRKLSKMGAQMQKIGAGLTVGLSVPLLGVAVGAVKAASDLETLETSLSVMTGSVESGKKALKDLSDFTASTPFQLEQVGSSAKQLLAFGFTIEEVKDKLQFLGDVSAGSGNDIGSLAQIFGQVSAAGKLTGERFNQLQERAVPIGSAIAKTMGIAESSVKEFITKGKVSFSSFEKAFQSLADEGGLFEGAMDKQSKTIAGLFSTLKDNVSLSLGELGKNIVETINFKEIIAGLITRVQSLTDAFKSLSPSAKKFILILGGIAIAVGPLLALAGTILPAIISGFALLISPVGLVVAGLTAAGVAMAAFGSSSSSAVVAIQKERKELFVLESRIKDVNTSNEDRVKLIDSLKKKYPQLLSDIDAESISNLDLSKKLALVNSELVNKIILQTQDDKIQKAITDTANRKLTILEKEDDIREQMFKVAEKENLVLKDGVSLREQARDLINQVTSRRSLSGILVDPVAKLSQEVTQLDKANLSYNAALGEQNALTEAKIDLLNRLNIIPTEDIDSNPVTTTPNEPGDDPVIKKIRETFNKVKALSAGFTTITPLTGIVAKMPGEVEALNDQQKIALSNALTFNEGLNQVITSGVSSFVDGFGSILENFAAGTGKLAGIGDLFLGTIANMAIQLGKMAISIGVGVGAIKKALQSLNPAVAIAAGIALVALGSLIKGNLNKISGGGTVQKFADGGIVGGSSFYGDKILARVNSGELILNQDQQKALYGMMGNSGYETTTTTKQIIEGDKLILVTERAQKKRDRRS